ncbi:MAG: transpeptidase family protein [Bacteroidetes bacterium]|uniref:Transpeptidase family protein n=1 Tax=Candidatus Cryptobacteroides merdavium TaxID=2840769 RepID=A0A9D9HCC1_9BACT|nr:transpeptidase family protein [Candidatus Cryptobacteroides merdavium]
MRPKNMENMTGDRGKKDRAGMLLFGIYLLCLVFSVVLVVRVLYIQFVFKPDPEMAKYFTPKSRKETIEPARGSIFAHDGRLLASSVPMYQIYMDCTVLKEIHDANKDKEKGRELENKWLGKARELSASLAKEYGDRSSQEYYDLIVSGRRNGRKYVKIGGEIDHSRLQRVKQFPLFNEGGYKGGIIIEKHDTRKYPYESLARRVIGYVKDNRTDGNNRIGIEGRYNYILHGKEGTEWLRLTDGMKRIPDYDSTSVQVEDGKDLRITIDIDMQDIADRALRKNIGDVEEIEGGCAIIMDVKTGAIRAMVNLRRDKDGNLGETYNYAIGRAGDPGSVFKLTTLMTLLEDGKVTLDTKVPTFGGKWSWNGERLPADPYLRNKGEYISVLDGLKISSNHVFRYLACENYGGSTESQRRFVEKLYEYKMNEKFDFDLTGLAEPVIPTPDSPTRWSGTTLPSIAIGYSVLETPLHILMFYNGIANKGKLMKPYILEAVEKNGRTVKNIGPEVLNGSICSKATADTLTRALKTVVQEGTGRRLKGAKCEVAGKTGTAQIPFITQTAGGKARTVYKDQDGRRQHQGTFVGFFPADAPEYSMIVSVYSKLSTRDFYGGNLPANAFREIVDNIYSLSPEWGNEIRDNGKMPEMKSTGVISGDDRLDEVPDVKGLGLTDAMWSVENCGYRCVYEGCGHVTGQTPPAGTRLNKGETVKLTLK